MAVGKIVKRDEFELDAWLRKQQGRAAEMLEGWGLDPKDLLSTEIGWLIALGKFDGRGLDFDLFQLGFMTNTNRFRSQLKARQIGFSFSIACESLSRCHLKERHTSVCVSYNLDDAKEKIALVKELHDELPLEFQKKIVIDSKTVVGFQSNSSKRRISKVVSNPAKAPRGKTGDVYLDELAHCQNDKAIYAGATALIARSGGQLTVGSTPLGKRGVFHGIHTQEFERYPGFWRQDVPWWLCRHFSTIAANGDLCELAAGLPTEIRVERYGTQALKDQFNALPLEDFQQEFECLFQDERVAFFPYELILPCCRKEASAIPVYDNIRMLSDVAAKLGPLRMGFDVGRSKHPSELHIFEMQGETYILRYAEAFKDVPFPKQRARLFQICDILGQHWQRFLIDETGLGKNLAEDMTGRYGRRVKPITFTNAVKESIANNMKILFQQQNVVLPRDRDLIAQIHAIKQKLSDSGNAIFDVERNRHHHADKFWSIGLACYRKRSQRAGTGSIEVRVLGDRAHAAPAKSQAEGLIERLFDLTPPRPSGLVVMKDPFADMDAAELALKSKQLATAMRVWRDGGDEEKAKQFQSAYKRLRREVERRASVNT